MKWVCALETEIVLQILIFIFLKPLPWFLQKRNERGENQKVRGLWNEWVCALETEIVHQILIFFFLKPLPWFLQKRNERGENQKVPGLWNEIG
jgi:hypothetical protein